MESLKHLFTVNLRFRVALRLRRLCSEDTEYDAKATEYKNHLTMRGYDRKSVQRTFSDTRKKPRNEACQLASKIYIKNPIIFATKFNPRGPDVNSIVRQHLPILTQHPLLKELFLKRSIMVANKREIIYVI